MGVLAFVLAVISIIMKIGVTLTITIMDYPIMSHLSAYIIHICGIILAIMGLTLGVVDIVRKRKENKPIGMAVPGIIVAIISIIMFAICVKVHFCEEIIDMRIESETRNYFEDPMPHNNFL